MSSADDVLRRGDDGDAAPSLRRGSPRTPRGWRRRSRGKLPGGALEQPVAVVARRVVDDIVEEHLEDAAELGPFAEPELA